jgi:hypothetical protein
MPRLESILISISLMWLPAVVLGTTQGGAISGVVVDDKGVPTGNALVLYRSVQRWCEVRMGAWSRTIRHRRSWRRWRNSEPARSTASVFCRTMDVRQSR